MGRWLRPTSLTEALGAMADQRWTVIAGGTDHFPARLGAVREEDVLDITALAGLRRIETRPDGLFIPCAATWTDLIEADLPPAFDGLRALGARVILQSVGGRRDLSICDFVRGNRRTARRKDELVLGIVVPTPSPSARGCFLKLGARRYLVISIVSVAAVLDVAGDGTVRDARIAVGACTAAPVRLPMLETALVGQLPSPDRVQAEHLAPLAPIDDVRASAEYRLLAAQALIGRALAGLAESRMAA